MKAKILIEVKGGMIQQITSTDPQLEISVVDYDSSVISYHKAIADKIDYDEVFDVRLEEIENVIELQNL